jgi:hypothetical protein
MGCLSPKLVVVVILSAMAGYGDAGTEPPNTGFAVAVVAGDWPSCVLCLPAIVYDYATYLVW